MLWHFQLANITLSNSSLSELMIQLRSFIWRYVACTQYVQPTRFYIFFKYPVFLNHKSCVLLMCFYWPHAGPQNPGGKLANVWGFFWLPTTNERKLLPLSGCDWQKVTLSATISDYYYPTPQVLSSPETYQLTSLSLLCSAKLRRKGKRKISEQKTKLLPKLELLPQVFAIRLCAATRQKQSNFPVGDIRWEETGPEFVFRICCQ